MDLGWCYWLQTNLPQCQAAFASAVGRLPVSADLAIARFKLGDAQFDQTNYPGALTNYAAVIALHENKVGFAPADWEMLETNLLERALYQAVLAGLKAGDVGAATNALAKILQWYPRSFHTDRAVLMAGQELSREGDPARARQIFWNCASRRPTRRCCRR